MKFRWTALAVLMALAVPGSAMAAHTTHAQADQAGDSSARTPAAVTAAEYPSTAFPQRFWQRKVEPVLSVPAFAPAAVPTTPMAPAAPAAPAAQAGAAAGDAATHATAHPPNSASASTHDPLPGVAPLAPAQASAAAVASSAKAAARTPAPAPASPPAVKPAVKPAAAAATPKPLKKPQSRAPVATEVVARSIRGQLQLTAGARQTVAAGEVSDGLVYFLPRAGGARPRPARFVVGTHSKGFTPNLLVVPVGSTVSFPNRDTILHNVYSRTPGASFDLATFGPGESRQTVFNKAGLVIVNCNVHHSMRANVVVLATPYYTRPGKDGAFELKDLPPGPGTLVFWHPRANAGTVAVGNGAVAPIVQRLVAAKPRLDAHLMGGK